VAAHSLHQISHHAEDPRFASALLSSCRVASYDSIYNSSFDTNLRSHGAGRPGRSCDSSTIATGGHGKPLWRHDLVAFWLSPTRTGRFAFVCCWSVIQQCSEQRNSVVSCSGAKCSGCHLCCIAPIKDRRGNGRGNADPNSLLS
jgi:hypothetical protein